MLGFVVTSHLLERFTALDEGNLTTLKNALVSATALAKVASDLGLGEFMLLGKGETQTGGSSKPNLLADTFEALLGAVYVESGIEAAEQLVERLVLAPLENHELLLENADPKTKLQEWAQARLLEAPNYEITHEGADHDRTFFATVTVAGVEVAGVARSRKNAEAQAALAALEILGDE